jgi:hypothetical protein
MARYHLLQQIRIGAYPAPGLNAASVNEISTWGARNGDELWF